MEQTFFTIGHSIRTPEEFITILKAHHITKIVDVRTVPRSRRNPQFNGDTLPFELEKAGIRYEQMKGLGGLRKPLKDSINTGWEVDTFRGYADYMGTPEFEENIEKLIIIGETETVAVMCAEAVYWRCHRRLIADALTVKGFTVLHITDEKKEQPHKMTPWLKVVAGKLTYPPLQPELFE